MTSSSQLRLAGALALVLAACGDSEAAGAGGSGGSGGDTAGNGPEGGQLACPAPFEECDGDLATVCETSTDSSTEHCGECDAPCPAAGEHEVPSCSGGTCSVECEAGWIDCDRSAAGCETPGASCDVITLASDIHSPTGLEVDDAYVYYGTRGLEENAFDDGTIMRVPKDGSGPPETIAEGQNKPLNLTIDDTRVYWGNRGTPELGDGVIVASDKDGAPGSRYTIADAQNQPGNLVIVGDTIYWTTRDDLGTAGGNVMSAPKDGSGNNTATVVATALYNPRDLAVHDGALYWATGGMPPDEPARLVRKMLPDGPEETLALGIDQPSFRMAIDATHVYLGSFAASVVFRIPVSGGTPEAIGMNAGQPNEIVVDDFRVFFTTAPGARVVAVTKDGADEATLAASQVFPSYLTQDETDLYWTDGFLSQPGGAIRKTAK